MNKKEKEIYEFVKSHNDNNKLNPFDMATFFYRRRISRSYCKKHNKCSYSVTGRLYKFLLKSLMEF